MGEKIALFNKPYEHVKKFDGVSYRFYSLKKLQKEFPNIENFPITLKILAENLLRRNRKKELLSLKNWIKKRSSQEDITFAPARVLMQDFTGVPAIVDLASMRNALQKKGLNTKKINPSFPVDLVIDHSVMVDYFGTDTSFKKNEKLEYKRNAERYSFLKWGQYAFKNFRVVPPGTGICHQVNLEYLAKVVWTQSSEDTTLPPLIYPDTLVGTDSHNTMINGLSVLGWGVGGIEAEAAMLGQPISIIIPEVIGFELKGALKEGSTATDLVLTITQLLRKKVVVGKFVEFFGNGLKSLSLADRATLANMAPEYGATCGYFPIDEETIKYLSLTGRKKHLIHLVEEYAKEQGLWRFDDALACHYTDTISLELDSVTPCIAGPTRPQDKINLSSVKANITQFIDKQKKAPHTVKLGQKINIPGYNYDIKHGSILIAAITSCTNTSNPSVMIAAGLLARKAISYGLHVPPWVKTSLAPGSKVVTDYLIKADLQKDLDTLGFNLVGYGCTTCIGNSGPLASPIIEAIEAGDLTVCSILSGNRNFEGRINPYTKASFLASPPLVVAYALSGSMLCNLKTDPIGRNAEGQDVFLHEIWPTSLEINELIAKCVQPQMFKNRYKDVFTGDSLWDDLTIQKGDTYAWDKNSSYIKEAPFFSLDDFNTDDINVARPLLVLGDSITTDHISPAGFIKEDSPAGKYLIEQGITPSYFNSYGSRRGNHNVMIRGTFANVRINNEMTPDIVGGVTKHLPSSEIMTVYDAAIRYKEESTPLIVIAGKEYGTGSSRDWAAKGTRLLGIKAVVAESFERIHRSNLIGMGVLPLIFKKGASRKTLKITGEETWSFKGISHATKKTNGQIEATITYPDKRKEEIQLQVCLYTPEESSYFQTGGILPYIFNKKTKAELS